MNYLCLGSNLGLEKAPASFTEMNAKEGRERSLPRSPSTPKRLPQKRGISASGTLINEEENTEEEGGKPTAILTCFQDSDEVTYVVRWEEKQKLSHRLVPSSAMRVKWPQMVIDFLQSYVKPGPAVSAVSRISGKNLKKNSSDH